MARNAEKAQSMLFRFQASQAADLGIIDAGRTRRPKIITEVSSIPSCEKWRGQVLKEISRKVSRIQDTSLSDFQVRDLNDEINRAMREKHMWEVQIRNLGGPNYMRGGGKVYDEEGREIPGGGKGYRYFGRARELPGVKELFEVKKPKPATDKPLESRADLRKQVDASYYGYNLDEEDGTLLAYEAKKEKEAFDNLISAGDGKASADWEPLPGDAGNGISWRLPTLDEVQEELVDRRRRRLLDKLG
ncbi:MAG: NineTeen Complex (NTC) component [Pycnora praestabilis]|nr:MAG: NineTeen Complex (NTC) component [Pycnora praestabilis]